MTRDIASTGLDLDEARREADMEPDEPRTLILVLCDEIERLRAEHRLMEQVIDDAHGELDYLAPGTNGLEHDLIERLVSIRDDQEHHDG